MIRLDVSICDSRSDEPRHTTAGAGALRIPMNEDIDTELLRPPVGSSSTQDASARSVLNAVFHNTIHAQLRTRLRYLASLDHNARASLNVLSKDI